MVGAVFVPATEFVALAHPASRAGEVDFRWKSPTLKKYSFNTDVEYVLQMLFDRVLFVPALRIHPVVIDVGFVAVLMQRLFAITLFVAVA